jgi:hypothetical protein
MDPCSRILLERGDRSFGREDTITRTVALESLDVGLDEV